jgi:Ca2+-binding RTX toxin-like protein
MKRIIMLVTVALMLGAAMVLSGVAQAAPGGNKANAQCKAEAVRTLQPGFKPSDYNFIGGTEEANNFDGQATEGADLFCGFGGNDELLTLEADDIFLGGAGDDFVQSNAGTVNGGEGNDRIDINNSTFNGGPGDDTVGSGPAPIEDGP